MCLDRSSAAVGACTFTLYIILTGIDSYFSARILANPSLVRYSVYAQIAKPAPQMAMAPMFHAIFTNTTKVNKLSIPLLLCVAFRIIVASNLPDEVLVSVWATVSQHINPMGLRALLSFVPLWFLVVWLPFVDEVHRHFQARLAGQPVYHIDSHNRLPSRASLLRVQPTAYKPNNQPASLTSVTP